MRYFAYLRMKDDTAASRPVSSRRSTAHPDLGTQSMPSHGSDLEANRAELHREGPRRLKGEVGNSLGDEVVLDASIGRIYVWERIQRLGASKHRAAETGEPEPRARRSSVGSHKVLRTRHRETLTCWDFRQEVDAARQHPRLSM